MSPEMLRIYQNIVLTTKKTSNKNTWNSNINTKLAVLLRNCWFYIPVSIKWHCFNLLFENVSLTYSFQKHKFRIASWGLAPSLCLKMFETESAFQIRCESVIMIDIYLIYFLEILFLFLVLFF